VRWGGNGNKNIFHYFRKRELVKNVGLVHQAKVTTRVKKNTLGGGGQEEFSEGHPEKY